MKSFKLLVLLVSLLILRTSSQSLVDKLLLNPALALNSNFFNDNATTAYLAQKAKQEAAGPQIITLIGTWTIYSINGKEVNVSATFINNIIKFTYCDQMKYNFKVTGKALKITANYPRVIEFCRSGNGLFQDQVQQSFVNSTSLVFEGKQAVFKDKDGNEKVRFLKEPDVVKSLPIPRIIGNWRLVNANGKSVNVNVTIDDKAISYKYCNNKTFNYFLQTNGVIIIIKRNTTDSICKTLKPTESELDSVFLKAVKYDRFASQVRLYDETGVKIADLVLWNDPIPFLGIWTTTQVGGIDMSIEINITGNRFLYSYCNAKSYSFLVSGTNISFGSGTATKLKCPSWFPSEDSVQKTFMSVQSYLLTENSLVFYDSAGKVAVRMYAGNQPLPLSTALVGNWKAVYVNKKTVEINVTITKTLIQYTYCNAKNIEYKIKGNQSLTLSAGISAKAICLGIKPSESQIDKTFYSVTNFRMGTGKAWLYDTKGTLLVTLLSQNILKSISPINKLT